MLLKENSPVRKGLQLAVGIERQLVSAAGENMCRKNLVKPSFFYYECSNTALMSLRLTRCTPRQREFHSNPLYSDSFNNGALLYSFSTNVAVPYNVQIANTLLFAYLWVL